MPDPVDLNFVASDITGGEWLQWGTSFGSVKELVDQAIAAADGKCIRRLVIAAHGSATGGFVTLDPGITGAELIASNIEGCMTASVRAELERLKPHLCRRAIVEFRVCNFGKGRTGRRSTAAVATLLGCPVTGPVGEVSALGLVSGFTQNWVTTYPAGWGRKAKIGFWKGDPEAAPADGGSSIAPVTAAHIPLPDVKAPNPIPAPVTGPPPRVPVGAGTKVAIAAGIAAVTAGTVVGLTRDPGTPPPTAGEVDAVAQDVRVSPVAAVFTQEDFTTTYSIQIAPHDARVDIVWSRPGCGQYRSPPGDPTEFVWTHPHPPCPLEDDHVGTTVAVSVLTPTQLFICEYVGSESGRGRPCVEVLD